MIPFPAFQAGSTGVGSNLTAAGGGMVARSAGARELPAPAPHGAGPVDGLIAGIYAAAIGQVAWSDCLHRVSQAYGLWVVQFFAVSSRGAVLFSFEGGAATPETAFDWFHKYHRMDPRAELVGRSPVGYWIACDEHFDDEYVAKSPFYQDFLIPYGGRYVYGAKVLEDESQAVVIAFHRGRDSVQLDRGERSDLERIAWHVKEAFKLQSATAQAAQGRALGLAVLERMRQPLVVLDANRRIVFANASGRELLHRADLLLDQGGYAICRDNSSDLELMYALRELLGTGSTAPKLASGEIERRGLRLHKANGRPVAATLLALKPDRVLGAFGAVPLAMLAVYEPGADARLDPFLLQTTFDLTPAEARVAASLVSGLTVKRIAQELQVSPSTIRTHLNNILQKTGTHRQAELVRVLLLSGEFQ